MSSDNLPLADLLKESKQSPSELCEIVIRRGSEIIQSSLNGQGISPGIDKEQDGYFPHDSMLQWMEILSLVLLHADEENLTQTCKNVVCKLCDPYLKILSFSTGLDAKKQAKYAQAVGSVLSIVLCRAVNSDVIHVFTGLFHDIPEDGLNAITVLNHVLKRANASEVERKGLSLSPLFDASLCLLQRTGLETCYLVCSAILPYLITPSHLERVEELWHFIVQVYTHKIHIDSLSSDLILTMLCCFSDFFIFYNNTSPFALQFPHLSLDGNGPLFDVRKEVIFWNIIQEGLICADPLCRKRCLFLVQCALASVKGRDGKSCDSGKKGVVLVESREWIFWWDVEFHDELSAVWGDLVLILETMEEKQVRY